MLSTITKTKYLFLSSYSGHKIHLIYSTSIKFHPHIERLMRKIYANPPPFTQTEPQSANQAERGVHCSRIGVTSNRRHFEASILFTPFTSVHKYTPPRNEEKRKCLLGNRKEKTITINDGENAT